MKRTCAWCDKDMGITPTETPSESIITHGVCPECADKLYAELGLELTIFLNKLAAPVVVVDETGTIQTANRQARTLLRKDLPDIQGYKGGDVFECAYAKLPEGCGNTVHCSGCTVRRTVMNTFQSGESKLRTPAYLNRGTPESCRKTDLLISTEKVKDVVLLRIDEVGTGETAQQ